LILLNTLVIFKTEPPIRQKGVID